MITTYKKRNQILAQFAAASFVIAEIIICWLHSDKLCWRRTKFKLVVYISNLLGFDNVLGEGMKEMLGQRSARLSVSVSTIFLFLVLVSVSNICE